VNFPGENANKGLEPPSKGWYSTPKGVGKRPFGT
jgi:hypothetical protein